MKEYEFSKIEKKWQNAWEKKKAFKVSENVKKKKYYVLEMFPYPSGLGLHMGHALNYTIGDIFARFKRMQGFNVLYPMGYDSFGLPAENAAIKAKTHPKKYTEDSIKNFIKQQKSLGLSYDWSRLVVTSHEDYYKWDQWIFLKMFEKGLAYKKKSAVNWCPKCKTVLANEQVHNGKCWRHEDTDVEVRHLDQWYFRITNYAEELNDFSKLQDWPELIRKLQENWINKSEGTEIEFEINGKGWKIFTTRPDTIFGVTFMVVSAQHPQLVELVTKEQKKEVESFLKRLKSVSEKEQEDLEKEGVFTGSYAINPITKEKVPIWAGNFVLADYGSGMVMAVPAHDQRDYEFAKKYNIPIKVVIKPNDEGGKNEKSKIDIKNLREAYTYSGNLINSKEFNDLDNEEAKVHITKFLEMKKLGRKTVNYKLRDWLISRQRYWGTPIPIVYCDKCGIVSVREKDLPVKLPEKVKFGEGNPLSSAESWINTKCPRCGGKARRETDTMDTFVNSSWYYLRYCDSKNNKEIFDSNKANYWTPVDMYIGGKEHACMHLIYIRYYTKFLRDLGLIKIDEPAKRLFNQGYLYGTDGKKMSKSLGNVIDPLETVNKFGTDSLRMYLVSVASPDSDFSWSDKEMQGSFKFVKKVWDYFDGINIKNIKKRKTSRKIESKINKSIKELNLLIEDMKYNLAVIKIRDLFDSFNEEVSKEDLIKFIKMFSLFCPHISEELWSKLRGKGFVSLSEWPKYEESKIDLNLEKIEKAVEQTVSDILNIIKIVKERQNKDAEKVYLYIIPNEKEFYNEEELSKRINKPVKVYLVNDKNKFDPENKSGKAKPGRPAIYIE